MKFAKVSKILRKGGLEWEIVFSFAPEKKIIWILLEKTHAAFLKSEKDEEKNYDREGKTDAQNKMDAS